MATFSVYDYTRKLYDYYEGVGPGGTHAGAPPAPVFRSEIGASPEGGAWRLPMGARKVGSGVLPRGRIASTGIHLGLGDLIEDPLTKAGLLAAAGYLAYKYLLKKRR